MNWPLLWLTLVLSVQPFMILSAAEQPCINETKPLMTTKTSWADISRAAATVPSDCFAGFFGEGISDTIVRKSVADWSGLLEVLAKQHSANDKLFGLVLKSINSTLNPDDIKALKKLAEESCPIGVKKRCGAISKQAVKALADYSAPGPAGKP
jgi:hypothetical protein